MKNTGSSPSGERPKSACAARSPTFPVPTGGSLHRGRRPFGTCPYRGLFRFVGACPAVSAAAVPV
ncbi:hypothetical protein [Azospirillum endophyticum]